MHGLVMPDAVSWLPDDARLVDCARLAVRACRCGRVCRAGAVAEIAIGEKRIACLRLSIATSQAESGGMPHSDCVVAEAHGAGRVSARAGCAADWRRVGAVSIANRRTTIGKLRSG